MSGYALEAHRTVNKQLKQLPRPVADGIRKVLTDLAADPHDQDRLDLKPIQGHSSRPPTLRLRIANYRILLKISHERRLVRVLRVGHRRNIYRGLNQLDQGIDGQE